MKENIKLIIICINWLILFEIEHQFNSLIVAPISFQFLLYLRLCGFMKKWENDMITKAIIISKIIWILLLPNVWKEYNNWFYY